MVYTVLRGGRGSEGEEEEEGVVKGNK